MEFNKRLQKYTEVIAKIGLNFKKGQGVVIRASVDSKDFVREMTKTCYKLGAGDVAVIWRDDVITRNLIEYADNKQISTVPKWFTDMHDYYVEKDYVFLAVIGDDPNVFEGLDTEKIRINNKARAIAVKNFKNAIMSDQNSWCVVGAATPKWAKSIFKDLDEKEAVEKLWDLIFYTSRIDEDWEKHIENLQKKAHYLNSLKIKYLHYTSKKGTDLKVELPKGYLFHAAGSHNSKGQRFVANIPTEEVFSMPHKDGVNGVLYSTKPLNESGNLSSDFVFTFKDGKVVEVKAKKGEEHLKTLIQTDENAAKLGEIAIVPFNSPISRTNVLFNETLYDENASCHFALGQAYPSCIENGVKLSDEELLEKGANKSLIHVDFMVGDETLNITAYTEDGKEVPIFINGDWA